MRITFICTIDLARLPLRESYFRQSNIVCTMILDERCYFRQSNIVCTMILDERCYFRQSNIVCTMILDERCYFRQSNIVCTMILDERCYYRQSNIVCTIILDYLHSSLARQQRSVCIVTLHYDNIHTYFTLNPVLVGNRNKY